MNTVIDMQGVGFAYGLQPVLQGIDLQVPKGEFLAVVGPNAGGKSTLLKVLLGQLQPQCGCVRVLGAAPRKARRAIGYVPQYPNFYRDFPISVGEVVALGALGHSGTRCGMQTCIYRALQEVEAVDLADRPIGSLSGGQLQRVLLARGLVTEPEILILDEPTANIDQRAEWDIFERLKRLNRRMTLIVVSHDIAFISAYVDRVACLNRTLICHATSAIDSTVIHQLYGDHVHAVAHVH